MKMFENVPIENKGGFIFSHFHHHGTFTKGLRLLIHRFIFGWKRHVLFNWSNYADSVQY